MRYLIALTLITVICITSLSLFSSAQKIATSQTFSNAVLPIAVGEGIQLSHNGHFYEDTIQISLKTLNQKDCIYYTLDGSQPLITSEKYSKPIEIKANDTMNVKVLRAIAVRGNTESSSTTHTYFVGKGVRSRFSTMVVSLSTDPKNLYDNETGIFVEGKLRQDYILANPEEKIFHYHPANYNLRGRLYERPVNVEMFEADGKRIINQKAGMRTHGGWARSLDQKSIRLIARNEYDPGKGKFNYDFFIDDKKFDSYGSSIIGYDSLVLRNASNYEGTPMMTNEVASKLARDAGFHETLFFRPTAVFLNGEYYGFSFLEQSINEQTLQEAYNAPELAFDIAGVGETRLEDVNQDVLSDLETLNGFAYKDLTNDQIFKELSTILDVDNFLHYYALQLYFGNSDWPHNNLKRWRYTGDINVPNLHPYLDGRWRYILFDLDRTFGFMPDEQPILERLLGSGEKNSPLLASLLKRRDIAQQFFIILSELAHGAMAPENVEKLLNSVYEQSKGEAHLAYLSGKFSSSPVKDNTLLTFGRKRWDLILPQLKNILGYRQTFGLTLNGINKGIYPVGSDITVTPKLSRHEVFDSWLVNGVPNSSKQLNITQQDIKNGQVLLEQLSHVELPPLQLLEVSNTRNRVILRNNTNDTIDTKGFYLTDDTSNLTRWKFTPMSIEPGETVTIVGKMITGSTVLFVPQLTFNIQFGEIIILSNELGQVLDYKAVESQ